MNKVFHDADQAIIGLIDGMTLLVGGFGLSGNPENLITAVHSLGVKNLRLVSNNAGTDGHGLGVLLEARQVSHMTGSYVGENKEFERQFLSGELEVELCPQGNVTHRQKLCVLGAIRQPKNIWIK